MWFKAAGKLGGFIGLMLSPLECCKGQNSVDLGDIGLPDLDESEDPDSSPSPNPGDKDTDDDDDVLTIVIDGNQFPEAATHLDDAIKSGISNVGVLDRATKRSRHARAVSGIPTRIDEGLDRDIAPLAVINTGLDVSVRHISLGDNRGTGASIGKQIKGRKDGTKVRIIPINLPDRN